MWDAESVSTDEMLAAWAEIYFDKLSGYADAAGHGRSCQRHEEYKKCVSSS